VLTTNYFPRFIAHGGLANRLPAFFKQVGISASSVLHRPVYKLFSGEDQISSRLALGALADGLTDYYSAHRELILPDNHRVTLFAWVRSIQFGESRHALAEFSNSLEPRDSPLVEYLGYFTTQDGRRHDEYRRCHHRGQQ
jgi:hypothetical protein